MTDLDSATVADALATTGLPTDAIPFDAAATRIEELQRLIEAHETELNRLNAAQAVSLTTINKQHSQLQGFIEFREFREAILNFLLPSIKEALADTIEQEISGQLDNFSPWDDYGFERELNSRIEDAVGNLDFEIRAR